MTEDFMEPCPICLKNPVRPMNLGDAWSIECPCCGHYQVSGTAVAITKSAKLSERQRANISGWLFENPGFVISSANFDSLVNVRSPSFHSRADKLLLTLEKETEYAGQWLEKNPHGSALPGQQMRTNSSRSFTTCCHLSGLRKQLQTKPRGR